MTAPIDLSGMQAVEHGQVKAGDLLVFPDGDTWSVPHRDIPYDTIESTIARHGPGLRIYRRLPVAKQGDNDHGMACAASEPNPATEAIEIVLGERNNSYGDPRDDYTKTAKVWSGLLAHKLKADITPEEALLMMVGLKLSREIHKHKRDNIVDAHGYLLAYEWARTGVAPNP